MFFQKKTIGLITCILLILGCDQSSVPLNETPSPSNEAEAADLPAPELPKMTPEEIAALRARYAKLSRPEPFKPKATTTCFPGCRLKADENDRPVIPGWCRAWTLERPFCVREEDGVRCTGIFGGENKKTSPRYYTEDGTDLHQTNKQLLVHTSREGESAYVCTEIDLVGLRAGKYRPGTTSLYHSDPNDFGRGLSCRPGCLLGTERAFHGSVKPDENCLVGDDGARGFGSTLEIGADFIRFPRPYQLCTGLNFDRIKNDNAK
ncbi:MAG: hypothetical protein AAFR20_09930 [Pseudomonadota bacterium]